eukprot:COSAG02_NODE_1201_length_13902_cov_4.383033_8_plen_39_part_01
MVWLRGCTCACGVSVAGAKLRVRDRLFPSKLDAEGRHHR